MERLHITRKVGSEKQQKRLVPASSHVDLDDAQMYMHGELATAGWFVVGGWLIFMWLTNEILIYIALSLGLSTVLFYMQETERRLGRV